MRQKKMMNKEKFGEILKEYGYDDTQIELLWDSRPPGELDETALRLTAQFFENDKDFLTQK